MLSVCSYPTQTSPLASQSHTSSPISRSPSQSYICHNKRRYIYIYTSLSLSLCLSISLSIYVYIYLFNFFIIVVTAAFVFVA